MMTQGIHSRNINRGNVVRCFLVMALQASVVGETQAAQPGIIGVTHGAVDVSQPPTGSNWYYGLGAPIQLDATTGGLLVNIRRNGTPYADFEAGTDLIKFNSLNEISSFQATPVSRSSNETNPWTGTPAITSKYPVLGGFVPLGGRFANGTIHPHGGTGFGLSEVGFYPADYSQPLSGRIGYLLEFQQFSYDGNQFSATPPIRMTEAGLPVGNTGWSIASPGLSPAIPDGNDLLYPVTCTNGVAGVARFQFGSNGWQPTSFMPVTTPGEAWGEASLIRDVDGSFLFSGRYDYGMPLALWRSTDGSSWSKLINIPYGRAYAPVTVSQAVDGSPFFVTTTNASIDRNILDLVPINDDRNGVGATMTVRNGPLEFGPAPNGQGWHVDHGIGNVIRLADGQWHSLLTYRVDDRGEHFGLPASAYTGYYVEEVFSSGDPQIMGLTFVPEPASGLLALLAVVGFLVFSAWTRCRAVVLFGMLAFGGLATIAGNSTTAMAAEPGIVGVSHGDVDAAIPPSTPEGQDWRYGLGMPIQLDSTTGGLLVNIRRQPTPYGDFEVGTDLVKFNSVNTINAATAVSISRPTYETNPWTGTPSISVNYPVLGGFVPRGAQTMHGSSHHYAGTGFGICEIGFYPSDYSQPLPSRVGYQLELQQFSYDGNQFTAGSPVRMASLGVGNTGWRITSPGLSPALFDGEDLLFSVNCSTVSGVARFQYGAEGWRPTSFVSITSGSEPSLIRDVDGSLLFTNRSGSSSMPLWRSTDGGATWNSLFTATPSGRPDCPVVLNQAVDGTPFLTTTISGDFRNVLQIIPLNSSRTGLDTPIMLRDGPAEFGASPNGRGWIVDHGVGNVVRLADGNWHSLQTYRVADLGELQNIPTDSPYTGFYVEEVFSSGAPFLTKGIILVPEPSSFVLALFAVVSVLGFIALKRRHVVGFLEMLAWISFATIMGQSTAATAAQPGIVGVSHGDVDAAIPPSTPEGQDWRYGLGVPIQLDATTAGLLVNIRQNGTQYCDFEVGTDLIPFQSLDAIDPAKALPVSRPEKQANPWTGTPSITSKYPLMGGFVPLGSMFADGRPHPHGGTGFGLCEVGFYPADPKQSLPGRIGYHIELQQLQYDGKQFTASSPVRVEHLRVGDSGWNITGVGLCPAIPDGDDLLFPATCSNATGASVSGVVRFQHGSKGWQPIAFAPITNAGEAWFEPSLIRDIDGSLLFTARNDSGPLTLWASSDGSDWKRLIHIEGARAYAPVILNQAVDGTPFFVTTLAVSGDRNVLEIVPINADRTGVDKSILIRNGLNDFGTGPTILRKEGNEFGPPPNGIGWHIDHGTGLVVRLADGRWHSIITHRVDAKAEHFGQPATPFTGHYVEEVLSSGDSRPMGLVFEPSR